MSADVVDRFLVLRTGLAEDDVGEGAGEGDQKSPDFKGWSSLCLLGSLGAQPAPAVANVPKAVQILLNLFYGEVEEVGRPDTLVARNRAIRTRYAQGETLTALARAFGISPQRVYQIVRDE